MEVSYRIWAAAADWPNSIIAEPTAIASNGGPVDPEQRYLLDLQGFLLVKHVLSAAELAAAQQ